MLKKAGVDFGILGAKEVCCGGICDNVGDKKSFEEIAEKNLKMFKETGAKTIITNCPGCSMTFGEKYARHLKINTSDLDYQVVHATDYINDLIKKGKIKLTKNVDMKVTYHDPCHLGRRNEPYKHWEGKRVEFGLTDPPRELNRGVHGGYEQPREILKAIPGLELAEMERIKEYSWCCGSGGGAKSAFPDFAISTGQERIEEAKTTGASAIVSACPWCETHLKDSIDSMDESMKVYSFIELVKQAME